MFIVENHLSHNFTPKLWAAANLRFQYGGETSADDVKDDNKITILGGGLGVGYQVLPPLGIAADYGGVFLSANDAKGTMFRLSIIFTYANLKKL